MKKLTLLLSLLLVLAVGCKSEEPAEAVPVVEPVAPVEEVAPAVEEVIEEVIE